VALRSASVMMQNRSSGSADGVSEGLGAACRRGGAGVRGRGSGRSLASPQGPALSMSSARPMWSAMRSSDGAGHHGLTEGDGRADVRVVGSLLPRGVLPTGRGSCGGPSRPPLLEADDAERVGVRIPVPGHGLGLGFENLRPLLEPGPPPGDGVLLLSSVGG
jgi:hypothetical protein